MLKIFDILGRTERSCEVLKNSFLLQYCVSLENKIFEHFSKCNLVVVAQLAWANFSTGSFNISFGMFKVYPLFHNNNFLRALADSTGKPTMKK